MSVPVTILALALLALVVLVVSAPLRGASSELDHAPGEQTPERGPSVLSDMHELNTQREAKYREIRDAELDFRTGKLSKEDYEAIDAQLRAEALEILDRLRSS